MQKILYSLLVITFLVSSALSQQGLKEMQPMQNKQLQTATLGGGCFWCIEAVYEKIKGVESVVSGYAGGHKVNPTYREISSGKTGHAEVCQIHFDPVTLSYARILEIFWEAHDPTTVDRQGADIGSQYRSVIIYHDEQQKELAEKSKASAAGKFPAPIVTEIQPLDQFYVAEDYHQDYFANNPNAPYCTFVIKPKLDKLRKKGSIFE